MCRHCAASTQHQVARANQRTVVIEILHTGLANLSNCYKHKPVRPSGRYTYIFSDVLDVRPTEGALVGARIDS